MSKYHINPKTGNPGKCTALRQCPFGGESDHFDSMEDARMAYEETMAGETFSNISSNGTVFSPSHVQNAPSFKDAVNFEVKHADREFNRHQSEGSVPRWIGGKIATASRYAETVDTLEPGTPERAEAAKRRAEARKALLGADIVLWKNSGYYTSKVEDRMRLTAENVHNADMAIEETLNDPSALSLTADRYGVGYSDVRSILEQVQKDYVRPRASLDSNLSDLSGNSDYVNGLAYEYRLEPNTVSEIIKTASIYESANRNMASV